MNKYDAFISYRHAEPDKTIAEKLHKMLETYRVPSSLAKKIGKKKINRVFRDRDELPTSSNLAGSIEDALKNSKYLIVICSPRTAQSQWVLKEIETFSKLHGHDKILALLVEGEPIESFPEQLRFITKQIVDENGNTIEEKEEVEPLAADIRGNSLNEMSKNLKKELLRLLAPILGCSYDDLKQRHRERFIKRIISIAIFSSLFFLSFGSFSTWQALMIKQQVNKTLKGQSLYLSSLSEQLLKEGDRRTSILLALEALPKNLDNPERPYVEEAEYALSQGLQIYKTDNTFISDITLNHRKRVSNVQLSPDCSMVFTICSDGNIYLWDTEDGHLLFTFPHNLISLSEGNTFFSEDGKIIVSKTDGGITAWNTDDGKKLWEIEDIVNDFALSPDGKTIALVHGFINFLSMQFIDIQSGNELFSIPNNDESKQSIYSITFNKTGTKIALGTNNGLVRVFDIQNKKELYKLNCINNDVKNIFFSYDDKNIAVCSSYFEVNSNNVFDTGKGNIEIWNTENKERIINYELDTSITPKGSFSPVDSNMIIFIENEFLQVLDITSGKIIHSFPNGAMINAFEISNDGKIVISASSDGSIKFYSLSVGNSIDWWNIYQDTTISMMDISGNIIATSSHSLNKAYLLKSIDNTYITKISKHSSTLEGGKFSSDGKKALTYSYDDSSVYIWDVNNKSIISELSGFEGTVSEAYFTPDGNKVSILTDDGYIRLYDVLNGSQLSSINTESFRKYKFNSSGSLVALQIEDKVKIFDFFQCEEILSINNNSYTDKIVFSNNGNQVLIMNWEKKPSIYDVKTGDIIYSFDNVKIIDGAFNQDDNILALSQEKDIFIYETESFKELVHIKNILLEPTSIHFSYDYSQVIVGLDDKTIQIYDLKTGNFITELTGHTSNLKDCFYRNKGKLLMTIGEYGDCILWDSSNYKKLAYIDKVLDISTDSKTFLSTYNSDVIFIPRYDTKALVEIAKKELGNRELTEEEKLKYYIIE